jgi:hypothetical protein
VTLILTSYRPARGQKRRQPISNISFSAVLWTTGSEVCNAPRPLTKGLRRMSIKDLVVSCGVLIAGVAVAWIAVVTAI